MKTISLKLKFLLQLTTALAIACTTAFTSVQAEETMRLEWVIQGQFAGPVVGIRPRLLQRRRHRHEVDTSGSGY